MGFDDMDFEFSDDEDGDNIMNVANNNTGVLIRRLRAITGDDKSHYCTAIESGDDINDGENIDAGSSTTIPSRITQKALNSYRRDGPFWQAT
jgi:hypothetical protein